MSLADTDNKEKQYHKYICFILMKISFARTWMNES